MKVKTPIPGSYRALALSLFLACCSVLQGQNFLRQYPVHHLDYHNDGNHTVYQKANGELLLTATQHSDNYEDTVLVNLHIGASGEEISRDSLYIATENSSEFFMLEVGGYVSAYNNANQVTVNWIAANGDTTWHQIHTFSNWYYASVISLQPNEQGEVFLKGHLYDYPNPDSGYVAKFSNNGAILWIKPFASDQPGFSFKSFSTILPTPTGGCLLNSYYQQEINGLSGDYWLLNFRGSDGSLVWSYPYSGSAKPLSLGRKDFAYKSADQIYLPLAYPSFQFDIINLNGDFVGEYNLANYLWGSYFRSYFPTMDGGLIVVLANYAGPNLLHRLVRVNNAGEILWNKVLPNFTNSFDYTSYDDGLELSDGSLVLYGKSDAKLFLIKLSADGVIFPSTVTGRVSRDSTNNCLAELTDPPLANWVVQAFGNGLNLYASTDADGQYILHDLEVGSYEVHVTVPSYLWQPCMDSIELTLVDSLTMNTIDFAVQTAYDCPALQVDLGVGILRPCTSANYTVHWCNNGNQSAAVANLAVHLDTMFAISSASLPYTLSGDTLWFELGAVASGACGDIAIYGSVSCEAELGQTLCSSAHIFPDSICAFSLPGWSGARIEVSAACISDSVQLTIQNTGNAATSQALDFIVIDDHVITRTGSFNLLAGEVHHETESADGSTWRITAQQEPGYPFGLQMPSAGLEGCSVNGNYSSGILNEFANYTGNPANDEICQVVVSSFDPNDKQAFPTGVGWQSYIEPNTPLDYQIRFQNTGTDTAFTVVIRDTLSVLLDPATIRPGASSHPYTWALSGAGILTFTFNNILLPDSNINEAASHGFVQFHIDQRPNNFLGNYIGNQAGIYFDFNTVVLTNTVWHTIGHDFLTTATREPKTALPLLQVSPNPAS